MTDRDAPAPSESFRQLADQVDIHIVGGRTDVEMDIDINVELAREFKDAMNLSRMVGIVTGRAADNRRTLFRASTILASASGWLVHPSCTNTHSSRSMAQR